VNRLASYPDPGKHRGWLQVTAILCAALLVPGDVPLTAQTQTQTPAPAQPQAQAQPPAAQKRSPDQLDSLVAPIALYPDPLLAQVLAAATYPLEIVECRRWLDQNKTLKGEALTKAAAKQPWDPSVQALVAFPDVLKRLDEGIQWVTDLGNAVLDQQQDVMDAVQRMRKKAYDGGQLKASKEQKVEVKTVEQKTVVVVEPSDPQVIYVPSYNPTVVYGPPVVAYPPVVYPPPPSTGAVIATAAVSFGLGVAMGAMWGGCCGYHGYGWGCSWGGTANININNNFNTRYGYNNVNNINGGNRNTVNGGNRTNVGSGNSSWQHNPSHRKSVPYDNRNTAQKFGGSARGANGQTQRFDNRGQARDAGGDRGGANRGGPGDRQAGAGNRAGQGAAGDRGGQGAARNSGGDRVGNRSVSGGERSSRDAFGGSESRSRSSAASNRGFSSQRSSGGGGGGGSRGGGGGSRGGGGRRR